MSERGAGALSRAAFRLAAIGYLAYGAAYMTHAVLSLTPERRQAVHGVPWWAFYVAGAVVLVTFPVLLWHGAGWRGVRWLAAVLWLGPLAKAGTLWQRAAVDGMTGVEHALAALAAVASVLVARAAYLAFFGGRAPAGAGGAAST